VGEFSVSTDSAARRTGAGRAALEGLLRACTERGSWKLVSRSFAENAAGRALHRRAGFREVGVYRRHARLDGRRVGCVIVERLLAPPRRRARRRARGAALLVRQRQRPASSAAARVPSAPAGALAELGSRRGAW
jgi:phosphinothricin acetyltransferase